MTIIQGHADLLQLDEQMPDSAQQSLIEIESAASRAANLIRQLLMFSRKQVLQPKNINLSESARSMTAMLRRVLGEQITLRCSELHNVSAVNADPSMIDQVLMNLAVNARDAMPKGGELTIKAEAIEIASEQAAHNSEARAGNFVCLSVRDTGCGMDKDTLSHIFEPFFTTKDVGKGTGLGLATVYGIVKQHEGWIEVESRPGRGTVFRIFFPAVMDAAESSIPGASEEENVTQGNGETVLLVEDEGPVRAMVRHVIQRYGYSVIEARSGREALAIWQRNKDRVDLVLTDIVMPEGISGKDLARKILTEKPDVKFIFTTGYDKETKEGNLPLREGVNLLCKPYTPSALGRIIRRCLEPRSIASADLA